jgi:hypothetical protein
MNLWTYILESTDKLGRAVLVLVGMLMPQVPLFVQIFIKTVKSTLYFPELPAHWGSNKYIYIILWTYLLGSTDKLGRAVLVLVGMLMPQVPLFVKILTRTVEVTL